MKIAWKSCPLLSVSQTVQAAPLRLRHHLVTPAAAAAAPLQALQEKGARRLLLRCVAAARQPQTCSPAAGWVRVAMAHCKREDAVTAITHATQTTDTNEMACNVGNMQLQQQLLWQARERLECVWHSRESIYGKIDGYLSVFLWVPPVVGALGSQQKEQSGAARCWLPLLR